MNVLLDTSIFLGKFLYYFLESLYYKIIPKKKKDVTGEIVLITGAASGLGRLLAIKFASLGAILVLWDINEEGNMETCRMIKEERDAKVFAYTCDCSNRQDVYRVADQVKKEVGNVTILINNAGVVTGREFLKTPDHMVERSFLVNVMSHFWTYKAFLPAMLEANHGHLVCISSFAGIVGINGLSDYCASKFAAYGFAESLHFELKLLQKSKINTTIVCPYFIKTGMFEGCSTKYPLLLPMLTQEYAAQSILNAILEEQLYLIMPRFSHVALFLKQIISTNMMMTMAEYLGMDISLASFIEREKSGEVQTKTERKQQ
ncbi:short-chain dehydrogenase/reductase family 16C member 6 [Bos indicus x Bos taurus]|uniref:Short-chain dehydrogenase/reductase family 16C member 6 n=1 Tax=Bos indicus x Bos taurus TaxID=30522 RepID=A0A4W2CH89_BOBOX|nr:PREDICTED: short-chain dehydrogenase/reductase family 16C member 6 [Bos indicus]XP_027416422.1 short-chain dehydrogenase/reductase family 16C member 6 [Bos indicus x Bos taurus]